VVELEPTRVQIERDRDVTSIAIECRLTPETKLVTDYVLVPFEVVVGTARLELEYQYEGQQQPLSRNEIDLGLVDPRGAEFPMFPGFRGWSGNARRGAVLTEQAATPGFFPGSNQPGRWWVLLGLYKLAPEGVTVRVTVRLSPIEGPLPAPAPPPRRDSHALLTSGGRGTERWVAGDLHSHTHHSDAVGSLSDLAAAARQQGLEFLAITEHNTTSHFPHLGGHARPTLLPGEEVTTYYGHMNVWGNQTPLDFRARDVSELRSIIDAAHAQGAVVSASHPTISGMGWGFGYDLPLDCLEVWHGRAGTLNLDTLDIWERLLADGRRVVAVGGSDVHIGKPGSALPGEPTTWIRVSSLNRADVLDALRGGRVVVTAPNGSWLELEAGDGATQWGVGDIAPAKPVRIRASIERGTGCGLRLLSALGELAAVTVDRTPFGFEFDLDLRRHRFVRAELEQPPGPTRAAFPLAVLTNPIWSE
jgi:PHP domain